MGVQACGLVISGWSEWTFTGSMPPRPTILHVERFQTSGWGADYVHIWPMIVMVCQYAEFKLKWKTADEHLGCTILPRHILFLFILQPT